MNDKMFYKEQIAEMVQKMENCDILIYIYKLICDVISEEE